MEFFSHALKKVNDSAILTVATNGAEALSYLRSTTEVPHFVFLDINMPLVDGIECLKQFRMLYPGDNVPVIMLSTSGAPHMIERSFLHGASFYLQKPNHLTTLAEQIKFCLEELRTSPPPTRYIVNS